MVKNSTTKFICYKIFYQWLNIFKLDRLSLANTSRLA
jgi:hypothetical protein